jgi:amidase
MELTVGDRPRPGTHGARGDGTVPPVPDELSVLDATAQAELIRRRELTPAELVEAAIARIEDLNPQLNAVTHTMFDKARAAATDERLPDGPFRGVPFLVKDAVCHTAGDPYTCGMRFLKERNWTADRDTHLAGRFRAAGFVFVGKTNTPELATSSTCEPLAYGATHNPWDLSRSPGGSSGGSGAAVAAGLVPAAHGNDMGGSIRIPAAMCGLVGLKPSRARTSVGPDFGEYWGPLTHEHVLTRSVRDTAAILDCHAGLMPGDPYTAPPPVRPFLAEVGADPGSLRIGVLPGVPTTDHDVVAAVEAAAKLLESLGHRVEPSFPSVLLDREAFGGMAGWVSVGVARDLDRWSALVGEPVGPDDVEPPNWALAESARALTAVDVLAATERLWAWAREVAGWWADGFDVLVTPTAPHTAIPLGVATPDRSLEELMPILGRTASLTSAWNITGQPAISLPLGRSDAGLPIGVQLVAAYGREDVLLRLASQLEAASPWSQHRPPVHG